MTTENKRKRVCVVITARPSYSRIQTAMKAIQQHPSLELLTVVTSSACLPRYGNAIDYIRNDGFEIAASVHNVIEGEDLISMPKTTGLAIQELSTVFDQLKPDAVVTIADRYETMATAIAASYMKIPLIHIQGGEITGNIDEKVRHAITKLSDLHLVSHEKARERVIKMGENPHSVFVTGCPSIDIALEVFENSALDFNPFEKYLGVGDTFDYCSDYLVMMQHPVTNEYEQARSQITATMEALHELDVPVFCFWPNIDAGADGISKGIRHFRETSGNRKMHFFKNMESRDFLKLLMNSKGIVGNSSVAIRECSFLGIPAVNIGTRQSGRDRGLNISDVGYEKDAIRAAVNDMLGNDRCERSYIYGEGQSGSVIADVIASSNPNVNKRLAY